jgi:signal transduction histidine kinase
MKVNTGVKPSESSRFCVTYTALLQTFLRTGEEAALGRACDLGRQALAERTSLIELVSVHHLALRELLMDEKDEKRREALVRAAAEFFSEFLSPYEMTRRGFQDVLLALRQVNETLEEQIKSIAYAVHDEAGQLLVAVHLALAEVARELPARQREQLQHVDELLNEVQKRLRRYSHELRPTILDDLGWMPAIRFLAEGISERASLPIHIQATVNERLPGPAETAIYRIVQEALTNTIKHAGAHNVWIRAWKDDLAVCCSVKDDGAGFDSSLIHSALPKTGLGLVAMQERVNAIGGTLLINSAPGSGTEILIRLPLEGAYAGPHRPRG